MKHKLVIVHAITATVALLLITTFFTSTLLSEIFGSEQTISTVKTGIFYGIWAVIPLMAIAGITGNKMAPNVKRGVIAKKKNRMPFIAANGVLVLVPAAVYLESLATSGTFNTTFYIVQGIELLAGITNISLMSMNLRDGLKIRAAKRS